MVSKFLGANLQDHQHGEHTSRKKQPIVDTTDATINGKGTPWLVLNAFWR